MTIGLPVLKGTRLTLRRPREGDVQARLALGWHPEIIHMFGGDRSDITPMTEDDAYKWVGRIETHLHAWIVEHDGQLLGEIRLDNIVPEDRRAQVAIGLLDPNRLGAGLGREAIRLVLQYAFEEIGLHRIGVRVLGYNERALRSYSACGFQIEGRERESAYVAGEWHDDIIMGLLENEFKALT